jgi:hypothetical protein
MKRDFSLSTAYCDKSRLGCERRGKRDFHPAAPEGTRPHRPEDPELACAQRRRSQLELFRAPLLSLTSFAPGLELPEHDSDQPRLPSCPSRER